MFSIIVPLYNKEKYVEKTINSILSQTFKDFEIIIVNDGSTDNSFKVVENINDKRIKIFSKQNEGVSIARNYGVGMAAFDYICFLDADDEWLPEFLENMYNLIKKYPDKEFFSTALYLKLGDNLKKITYGKQKDFIIKDYCQAHLFRRWNICHVGTICVKKELYIKAGGFPPHVKFGEDLDMWLRIACATSCLVYSNNAYFVYDTNNRGTVSNKRTKHMLKDRMEYWKWYNYPYHHKMSLHLYTTKKLSLLAFSCLRKHSWKEALFIFRKIRLF